MEQFYFCLLYTSDAADEEDSVDLGGRRIIKKIVPETIVVTVEILKKTPGLITNPAEDSSPTANP